MSLVSRSCSSAISIAASLPGLPSWADHLLASAALITITLYRRRVSRYSGRQCLFEPSCSHRAASAFRQMGFRSGAQFARAQLQRCGGNFSLCTACDGNVILLTSDGMRFEGEELSVAIREGRKMPPLRSDWHSEPNP
ncbi:membrane protein insertion efficiency factor YidD [Xanthobacter flavus]|uniref:membrane protein insertion efficiency factor YidD n=1 Tax=Xanthobacter flavus TaxID=281 RepID=UPI00372D7236